MPLVFDPRPWFLNHLLVQPFSETLIVLISIGPPCRTLGPGSLFGGFLKNMLGRPQSSRKTTNGAIATIPGGNFVPWKQICKQMLSCYRKIQFYSLHSWAYDWYVHNLATLQFTVMISIEYQSRTRHFLRFLQTKCDLILTTRLKIHSLCPASTQHPHEMMIKCLHRS